jgi:hypothetical protein
MRTADVLDAATRLVAARDARADYAPHAAALAPYPALLRYCTTCARPDLALLARLLAVRDESATPAEDAGRLIFDACTAPARP